MAKRARRAKTRDVSMYRTVGQGASTVINSALSGVFTNLREETDLLMNRMETRVLDIRAELMRRTFASILIGAGALIIFTAVLLYLVDLLNMRWPTALLIVGIVMIASALIIRSIQWKR